MQTTTAAFPFLTLMLVVPLLGAIILASITPVQRVARPFGLGVSLVELVLALVAAFTMDFSATAPAWQHYEIHSWIPAVGASYALGVNGVAISMIVLACVLVPIVLVAAWHEQDDVPAYTTPTRRRVGFVCLILVLEAFLVLIFAARDVLLFYICFEAMLLPVYFLIGIYGGEGRRRAAVKFLLYSLFGGLIMLVGVVALAWYGPGGPQGYLVSSLAGTISNPTAEKWLFVAFFIGFAIKAPMWPLHTWLPDTTAEATPGTSTLLVGVMDKVGTFGMLMICWPLFPHASAWAAPVIVAFALLSIIVGGLVAIGQRDLMRLIAYTSVSHFGFMVLGIYSQKETAVMGAIVYMVAHGVATSAMFLFTGFLRARGGSYQISAYGGWQRVAPAVAGLWLIAGLASVALPGLSGFVPEYLVLMGSFQYHVAVGIIAVFGVIIAALYALVPYQRVFTGPRPKAPANSRLAGHEKLVAAPLLLMMLLLGFLPGPLLNALHGDATQMLTYAHSTSAPAATNTEGGN